ncbi:hypothetical protein [Sporanaerobacter sp. PP17-6a]|uniref:hypothetical protein n=1 Tax=Sporanaerobacter sp. PP17-6a TaxID=1891289 RepID=UPI0008A03A0B|nr:hypothetical protein [Sporanaerobacter sp. PP17-6a]SCL88136.1 hypothetical protein PP176A_1459 [Sporanaerobacter sp. PP17-6a]
MLEFIKANLSSIITIIIVIVGLLYLYKRGKKEFVKQVILSLVVQAEKTLGSGTGELKYAMVVENIYKILPKILTLLIGKKELDNIIEDSVQYLKKYLSKDKDLLGYDGEYMKVNFSSELQRKEKEDQV